MILGTSKISLNLGPIIGHFWARGPRIYGFSYTKILQKILESIWGHPQTNIIFLSGTSKNIKFGPAKHLFFVDILCWTPAPQKDWYILSFLKDIDHDTFWKILEDHLF